MQYLIYMSWTKRAEIHFWYKKGWLDGSTGQRPRVSFSLLSAQRLALYLALRKCAINITELNKLMTVTHEHARDNVRLAWIVSHWVTKSEHRLEMNCGLALVHSYLVHFWGRQCLLIDRSLYYLSSTTFQSTVEIPTRVPGLVCFFLNIWHMVGTK